MFGRNHNVVSDLEYHVLALLVSIVTLRGLGFYDVFPCVPEAFVHAFEVIQPALCYICSAGFEASVDGALQRQVNLTAWVEAKVQVKGCVPSGGVYRVVYRKFCGTQAEVPIALSRIAEASQDCLHGPVRVLRLTVPLCVIWCGERNVDSESQLQLTPELLLGQPWEGRNMY